MKSYIEGECPARIRVWYLDPVFSSASCRLYGQGGNIEVYIESGYVSCVVWGFVEVCGVSDGEG